MRFGILGPLLAIDDDGEPRSLRTPKLRGLLAVLLVHAEQVVSTARLVDLLWDGHPPAQAERVLQVYVSQLRRTLHPGSPRRSRDQLLARRAPGYRFSVGSGTLDLHQFERLVERARRARAERDLERAAVLLREALGLWRGKALADVDVLRQTVVPSLEEKRLSALEERIEADLACGRHGQLVGELQLLVTEHPFRERLCGQLMCALFRAGRQAEALAVYAQARHHSIEELGIEPCADLQRLQRQILAADGTLSLPAEVTAVSLDMSAVVARVVQPAPRQLPAKLGSFSGRAPELARLVRILEPAGPDDATTICAINGMAGVGKSELAIQAAHQTAPSYPDGQLYVDLNATAAASAAPMAPAEVLGRFLRSLGGNGRVPDRTDEAAALFRSAVAGRRLLVVLDNARDTHQIRPLLAGAPRCSVLVTSRRVLADLAGATHLHLDMLSTTAAADLLGRLAGSERTAAEPDAVAAVVRACDGLALALAIAGARLAARPDWPVSALAQRLADEERRLAELEVGGSSVRSSFRASYQELRDSPDGRDRAAARVFGILGLLDGRGIDLPLAARRLDTPEPDAERMLERLVDARLLASPAPSRYRMHDLLRLYARRELGEVTGDAVKR